MQITPDAIRARAEALAAEGRLEEAAGAYRELVAHTPFDPGALVGLARVLRAKGDVDGAINRYEAALRTSKNHPGVAFELISAQLAAGKVQEAERAARKTVQAHPAHAGAHLLLAQALMQGADPRRALPEIGRARRIDPRFVEAIALQGSLHAMLEEHAEAEVAFREALAQDPGHVGLRTNLAHSLKAQGNMAAAVEEYRAVIAADPSLTVAHSACADALGRLGRVGEGIALIEQALERLPQDAYLHHALGNLYQDEGRLEAAVEQQELALAADPGFGDAAYNLAMTEIDLGRWDRAALALAKAIAIDPTSTENHSHYITALHVSGARDAALAAVENAIQATGDASFEMTHGHLLRDASRFEDATEAYRRLAAASSGAVHADARLHVALNHLTLGRLREGWSEYLHRVDRPAMKLLDARMLLDPADFFEGEMAKTTSVFADGEQGMGDELFFMRFAASAGAKFGRLVLRPNARVRALLPKAGASFGFADEPADTEQCSAKVLMGDLPLAAEPGYLPPFALTPCPEIVAEVKALLEKCGPPPYIGVTWRAGITLAQSLDIGMRRFKKEVDPMALGEALSSCAGSVVVIQRGLMDSEGKRFCAGLGRDAFDFGRFADDMQQSLALLSLLDEYVCVSNTNVHLIAGLRGRRASILVPFPPEWRWQQGPGRSPWFPDFDVYRQSGAGIWSEPLQAMTQDLRARLGAVERGEGGAGKLVPAASVPRHSRASPSKRYLELTGAYRQLHLQGDPRDDIPPESMFPGISLAPQAGRIHRLVQRTKSRTLLDYGAGKGLQYQWRDKDLPGIGRVPSMREYLGADTIHCYDAGYPPFSTVPEGQFDGVICTDVLEHCPEEDMDWIVGELFSYARNFVFANVASYPARKTLPTGENAHITQRPAEYWDDLFRRTGRSFPGVAWEVYVVQPTPEGGRMSKRLSGKGSI